MRCQGQDNGDGVDNGDNDDNEKLLRRGVMLSRGEIMLIMVKIMMNRL